MPFSTRISCTFAGLPHSSFFMIQYRFVQVLPERLLPTCLPSLTLPPKPLNWPIRCTGDLDLPCVRPSKRCRLTRPSRRRKSFNIWKSWNANGHCGGAAAVLRCVRSGLAVMEALDEALLRPEVRLSGRLVQGHWNQSAEFAFVCTRPRRRSDLSLNIWRSIPVRKHGTRVEICTWIDDQSPPMMRDLCLHLLGNSPTNRSSPGTTAPLDLNDVRRRCLEQRRALARHGVDGSSGDLVVGQRPNHAVAASKSRTSLAVGCRRAG